MSWECGASSLCLWPAAAACTRLMLQGPYLCLVGLQVDVFSFGVVLYELMTREVTSAVVIQSGDPQMPELYAFKVMQHCQ